MTNDVYKNVKTYKDLLKTNDAFFSGLLRNTFYDSDQLDPKVFNKLKKLNKLGIFSVACQSAICEKNVWIDREWVQYGKTQGKWYIDTERKSYFQGYVHNSVASKLLTFLKRRKDVFFNASIYFNRGYFSNFPHKNYYVERIRSHKNLEGPYSEWEYVADIVDEYHFKMSEIDNIDKVLEECTMIQVSCLEYCSGSVEDILLEFYKEKPLYKTPEPSNSKTTPYISGHAPWVMAYMLILKSRLGLCIPYFNGLLQVLHWDCKSSNDGLKKLHVGDFNEFEDEVKQSTSRLTTAIKSCWPRKHRFLAVFLQLSNNGCGGDTSGHANIILIDKKNKTAERFDPNGHMTVMYDQKELDEALDQYFRQLDLVYESPTTICPYIGPQVIEHEQATGIHATQGGFCAAWSMFYLESRLLNPDVQALDLQNGLIEQIQKKMTLYKFMVNYSAEFLRNIKKFLKKYGYKGKNIQDWGHIFETLEIASKQMIFDDLSFN